MLFTKVLSIFASIKKVTVLSTSVLNLSAENISIKKQSIVILPVPRIREAWSIG